MKINFLAITLVIFTTNAFTQQKNDWIDIELTDTIYYIDFTVKEIANIKYGPSNLFDQNIKTCWVNGDNTNLPGIFLKLPDYENIKITLFSGYGKSEDLFMMNSRPKRLKLSAYLGINPEGYVSENTMLYKSLKISYEQFIELEDNFEYQTFQLNINRKNLNDFKKSAVESFKSSYDLPVSEVGLILKMEVAEVYKGSKYEDVCISELFFNDCVITKYEKTDFINDIYIDDQENALLLKNLDDTEDIIFKDESAVLQLIEVSENKKWAILISMPAEVEGRAETTYLLVDILNKEIVNSKLKLYRDNYLSGSFIYFDDLDNKLLLIYTTTNDDYDQIELR